MSVCGKAGYLHEDYYCFIVRLPPNKDGQGKAQATGSKMDGSSSVSTKAKAKADEGGGSSKVPTAAMTKAKKKAKAAKAVRLHDMI